MQQDVLLVGSVPSTPRNRCSALFGGPLGGALKTMPDGEVGPRKHWISRIHYQVLVRPSPSLKRCSGPRRRTASSGCFRQRRRRWLFKVKDGVERVRFGDVGWRIGYARDAINSFFVFKTLREKGELPKHLRFQVSLASVNSALPPRIFPNQRTSTRSGRDSPRRWPPRSTPSSSTSPTTISRSSGTVRPRCRTPTARCRAIPPRAPSSATSRIPHVLAAHPREVSSSATTSASARSAAGRALRPPICRQPSARQRHRRGVRPPRRLDSHSGSTGRRRNPFSRR